MTQHETPRQIIGHCLAPLALDTTSHDYEEACRRLEGVLRSYETSGLRPPRPRADLAAMPTLTINEFAHGDV